MRGKAKRITRTPALQSLTGHGGGLQTNQENKVQVGNEMSQSAPNPTVQMAPSKEDEMVSLKPDEETLNMKTEEEE